MLRFSLRFNNDLPVRLYPQLAAAAEEAGFDQFWVSDDLFLRGVWPILSACAVATSRIKLGTGLVNPYTAHPAELAMQAAALDELSGGRMLLGVGAGAGDFLEWVGLHQQRPLARSADTIVALQRMFAGQRGSGPTRDMPAWNEEAYMRFATRQIPIYLGAMGAKMLRLIGSHADGGLPLLFPPEHYTTAMSHIQAGAAEAGRDIESIDVAACIWVSIDEDREAAADVLREKIAYYGHALGDLILANLGVERSDFAPIAHAIQVERDLERAKRLVTDDMMRIGVVGNSADLIERLEALVAQGARHLSFGPPLGPDQLSAIRLLGREVLPHFRDR